MSSTMTAVERRAHWTQFLQSEEGRAWDYSQAVIASIEASFSRLEAIFGQRAVALPLARILKEAAAAEGEEGTTWRERLDSTGPLSCEIWPITLKLRELGLYARYGVTEAHVPPAKREAHIEALLRDCEAFLRASPMAQIAEKTGDPQFGQPLGMLVSVARARKTLDNGEGYVDASALAVLGGVSLGRIRNLMAGCDRTFETHDGRVSATSALGWLEGRPAFWDSSWREEVEVAA